MPALGRAQAQGRLRERPQQQAHAQYGRALRMALHRTVLGVRCFYDAQSRP